VVRIIFPPPVCATGIICGQTFIMFAMTVYKCSVTLRGSLRQVMPVWQLFLRDGVLWFFAVFSEFNGKRVFAQLIGGRLMKLRPVLLF
jgi:hypothetical protein